MEIITLAIDTTVDENDGSNDGTGLSLRDALIIAQQSPENEYVIELQGGAVYTLDISGGDSSSGDLDVSGNVTVRANGSEPAIIDASGLTTPDRVIDVFQESNVNLENLMLTGGIAEQNGLGENGQDFGGGLRVLANSTVNITDSSIVNNIARNLGGGIYIDPGATVNLTNSEVSGNQANGDGGGGIWNSGGLTIQGSRIAENSHNSNASIGLFTGGGGINNRGGNLVIETSEINENFSVRGGGGIENESISNDGSLSIENTIISGNISRDNGAGISTADPAVIVSSTISNNTADSGVIDSNGGGISVFGDRLVTFDVAISNNTATNGGGGLNISGGDAVLYSTTINDNLAESGSFRSGGDGGGGIVNGSSTTGGTLFLVNSTVSGNASNTNGGGINSSNIDDPYQETLIFNSTIVNNIANNDGSDLGVGGGIFNPQSDRLSINNSIVSGNLQALGDTPSDFYGAVNGNANNLIGSLNDVQGTIGTGSDLVELSVELTPLQDNGGITLTHAPLPESPVIDAGNNAGIITDTFDFDGDGNTEEPVPIDQIGNQRIAGTIDIGAVEFGSTPSNNSPTSEDIPVEEGAPEELPVAEPEQPPVEDSSGGNTIYRFFNQISGVHFYTANTVERDNINNNLPNFISEGASYQGVDPLTGVPEPMPVYRFLNQDTGVHLYTISETEKDVVAELDNYNFEGEAFFAYETEVDGSIPIYRFFNPSSGAHFYTPSAEERGVVEANLPDFQSEGIAYYALPIEL